jgi:hypothetical protein
MKIASFTIVLPCMCILIVHHAMSTRIVETPACNNACAAFISGVDHSFRYIAGFLGPSCSDIALLTEA